MFSNKSKLKEEYLELKDEIKQLKKRLKEANKRKHQIGVLLKYKKLPTVKLYALELESGYWYIGMSYNVNKRVILHSLGKGAAWTKLHKPLSIFETRETNYMDQELVAPLEDDMTLEYALKYGSDNVRGGQYCKVGFNYWPDVIAENEIAARE